MLLDPRPDCGQTVAERPRHDVVGASTKIARSRTRKACDLFDHLGVVVGGQRRFALAAFGHRQPADEVGQEAERRRLELGVLVQVVVELPGLVADPEVVRLVADDVVEGHEVRDEDLVHPPPRLEAVQLVLARLGCDVSRLVRERSARRMDAFAAALEHRRHRVLSEPVDLEGRVELSQLVGDRDVAPGVAEADRRRDVQRALGPAHGAPPHSRRTRPVEDALREVAQHQVEGNRVASVRAVAGPGELDELGARQLGEDGAPVRRDQQVLVALHHEQRAANLLEQAEYRLAVELGRIHRQRQRVGSRVEAPGDRVLERPGRVRLGIAAAEEELEIAAEVLLPVVPVRLGPALVLGARLVNGKPVRSGSEGVIGSAGDMKRAPRAPAPANRPRAAAPHWPPRNARRRGTGRRPPPRAPRARRPRSAARRSRTGFPAARTARSRAGRT